MLPNLKMNVFGAGADRPLSERLATGSAFSAQTIPAEFDPLPTMVRPDPVGHLLGSGHKPASVQDAVGTITKGLLDAEASQERDALLREWFSLAPRIEEFITQAKEKHRAALRRQIAELTPQCRASLDRWRVLRQERNAMEGHGHALKEKRSETQLKLRVALESRPDDDSFPTDDEIAQWNRSVARARAADERVAAQQAELQEFLATKNEAMRVEAAQLRELKRRREDCRDELEGRPRKGPFGLQEMPGS